MQGAATLLFGGVQPYCPRVVWRNKEIPMLQYAVVFLVIAVVAAIFGFGGIAAGAAGIAKILFVVFLIGAIVMFLMKGRGGRTRV
jgi:uncharacterized membrane protein YtjA (UPF0391 family)